MKKIISVIFACWLVFLFPAWAYGLETVKPTELFYVADYANVLSEETEAEIVTQNDVLYEKTGAQIVVVTVDFLDGNDIGDYAYSLFNDWGIGSAEKNNGLLLLLAIGEENYYALQGKGLEDRISSGDLDQILYDYLEEDFAAENYDAGVQKVFSALYSEVSSYYGIFEDSSSSGSPIIGGSDEPNQITVEKHFSFGVFFDFFKLIGIAIIVIVVVVLISVFGRRGPRPPRYRTTRYRRYPPRRPGPMVPPPPPRSGGIFGSGGRHPGGWGIFGGGRSGSSGSGRRSGRTFGGSRGGFSGGRRSGGGGVSRGGGAGRRR